MPTPPTPAGSTTSLTNADSQCQAQRDEDGLAHPVAKLSPQVRDKRALAAVGNSILTIAWHLLSDPGARFTDLGPDWHDRLAPQRRKRHLIAELERLSGKKVTLQDAA